jgi:hypothetical protein
MNITNFYSNLPSLQSLNIGNNDVTDLNLSRSPNLTTLNCSNNDIATIDFSGFVNLTDLNIAANQLTNIDISACKNLSTLNVASNNLTSIYLANNAALRVLDISNNNLTKLDLVKNPNINQLSVAANSQLTSITISIYDTNTNMNNVIANATGLAPSGTRYVFCSYSTTSLSNYGDNTSGFVKRLSDAGFRVVSPTVGNFVVVNSPTASDIGNTIAYSTSSLNNKNYSAIMFGPFSTTDMPASFLNTCQNLTDLD